MELNFGLLKSIHSLLQQQTILNDRLQRGPRRIKLIRENEARFLQEVNDAKELYRKTKMAADAKQLLLDEREAKLKDFQFRLNTCDSNKEFQLLKERIEADQQANSVLQDEIFEMLERLDDYTANIEQAKENYEKAKLETKRQEDEVNSEMITVKEDLASVASDLVQAEAKLPRDILSEYRRKLKGLGDHVLGETEGSNCGNCYQQLTMQMLADLKMKRAVYCQGCGCLLYLGGSPATTVD